MRRHRCTCTSLATSPLVGIDVGALSMAGRRSHTGYARNKGDFIYLAAAVPGSEGGASSCPESGDTPEGIGKRNANETASRARCHGLHTDNRSLGSKTYCMNDASQLRHCRSRTTLLGRSLPASCTEQSVRRISTFESPALREAKPICNLNIRRGAIMVFRAAFSGRASLGRSRLAYAGSRVGDQGREW